ncbi:MAG TPA: fluoride efflux transporter CrcB [Candidatus Limnocylindrales bacterium]|nr:fluoride efflux transporter CrcB [Candidatus Limnocylindrales bacterium]
MPEPLLASLSIGAGAFVGANLRYGIGLLWGRLFTHPFPGDTLVINVAGSFLLAFVAGLIERQVQVSHYVRLLLTVGFCGGFTTFSTFALETMGMLRAGSGGWAALYMLASVGLSVLAAFAGFWLAGRA